MSPALRQGERVFVDTGAWIALALVNDPLHAKALAAWANLEAAGARLFTSVPVVLETFTFLDRNTRREVATAWREALNELPRLTLLPCLTADLPAAWRYFDRREYHRLSAVDATSFALMTRHRLTSAFAFDHHFAVAGFRLVS